MNAPYYEVLSYDHPDERRKWRDICQRFENIDIFYYPEYVYLYELKGDGKAHCFVYYDNDGVVIYPFIKRNIRDLPIFKNIDNHLFDIISPYGYSGYLKSNDNIDINLFFNVFKTYCIDNNIVSEFIRFNPLLDNFSYCSSQLDSREWNEIIIIDLEKSTDEIWGDIAPTCRNKIRKAQKNNITIMHDMDYQGLEEFYNNYTKTMRMVRAKDYYYFSMKWFKELINILPNNVGLFHAMMNGKIIMSAMFLFNERYLHYFLSGSLYETRDLGANNLLLYGVLTWAKANSIKIANLGGGYLPEDSLFKFKASFSSLRRPYFIGKIIHNNTIYQELVQMMRYSLPFGSYRTNEQTFPAYRNEFTSNIVIIGASGHARVCLDMLLAQGRKVVGLYDDDLKFTKALINGYPVLGSIEDVTLKLSEEEWSYIVAIGDNQIRKAISQMLSEKCSRPAINAIHPSAIVSPNVVMGYGNFIAPGVIINSNTVLGDHTIINTGATVDHDNRIHDFAQISPGCNLGGNVTVEEGAFLGTGAVVIPGKTIGAHAIVGAGAVVIHDVRPYSTAVGVPARVIKEKNIAER